MTPEVPTLGSKLSPPHTFSQAVRSLRNWTWRIMGFGAIEGAVVTRVREAISRLVPAERCIIGGQPLHPMPAPADVR